MLWPDECVLSTEDAALLQDLNPPPAEVIRKVFHKDVDSYSTFEQAERKTASGLSGYAQGRAINALFITWQATDVCVAWTAIDARKCDFDTYVFDDATRGIDLYGSLGAIWKDVTVAGVKRFAFAQVQSA